MDRSNDLSDSFDWPCSAWIIAILTRQRALAGPVRPARGREAAPASDSYMPSAV